MDHHELHNIHGLTVGDSVELNNILYSLDKYSKELEVFQTIHDPPSCRGCLRTTGSTCTVPF